MRRIKETNELKKEAGEKAYPERWQVEKMQEYSGKSVENRMEE